MTRAFLASVSWAFCTRRASSCVFTVARASLGAVPSESSLDTLSSIALRCLLAVSSFLSISVFPSALKVSTALTCLVSEPSLELSFLAFSSFSSLVASGVLALVIGSCVS